MESLVFVALSPVAAILMLVVALVAWRRRDRPGGLALVAFSLIEAGWLGFDALSVVMTTPEATIRFAQGSFLWAALLGVAWLAFVLDYTGRFCRRWRVTVGVLAAWCVAYGLFAFTNDSHHLVWSSWETVVDGPFLGVRYTLGPLAWAQTGFMWVAMLASYGVILWMYSGARARERDLSRWIVAGALVPLVLNMAHQFGMLPVEKDFTPLAMAISSGAFALGLTRYRFLDLRPVARETLVSELAQGVLVLDPEGCIADVNPAFGLAFAGSTEWVGRPLADVMPPLAEALDSGTDVPVCLGEDARAYDLRVSPLTEPSGRSSGRLVLIYDVTRRLEEKASLRLANTGLYRANRELQARNEELDAFAHTVAHDLKNSIQGVLGYSEILRDEGPELDPDTHSVLASDLVRSAVKMDSIVGELLLLAGVRQASVDPRPMAMHDVLDEAMVRVARSLVASGATVSRPAVWPVAVGHAPWVEEIWTNYLNNAAKYGGPTITLGAETLGSGVARFWVHDDGHGLSPEAQAKLFQPFSRVGSGDVDGHGLGLSIVRRIVERLDGTCGVESAPGLGTRFWFALPLASPAEPSPAEPPTVHPASGAQLA